MQADRRLVEHVEHAGQARADLAGQADALALAAGERAGGARQGQVVEADVDQEAQAVVDLLQDPPGDLHLLVGELRRPAPRTSRVACLIDRSDDLADVLAGDLHRQRLGLQAVAVAGLARASRTGSGRAPRAPRRESVSRQRRSRLGMHALEGLVDLVLAGVVVVDEADLLVAGAVQDHLPAPCPAASTTARPSRSRSAAPAPAGSGCRAARGPWPRARSRPCAGSCPCRERPGRRRRPASTPRPSQTGQAPNGLLNENSRGSISVMVKPETGQANFSENSSRSRLALRRRLVVGPFGHRDAVGQPQRRLQAVGQRAAPARPWSPARSTTTSMSCLNFLSSAGASSIGIELAVDLQRAGSPGFCQSAISLRYSPLRPRTTGASR